MPKFKAGMKVRCTHAATLEYRKGRTYTVQKVNYSGEPWIDDCWANMSTFVPHADKRLLLCS